MAGAKVAIVGAICEECGAKLGPNDVGRPPGIDGRFEPAESWPVVIDVVAVRDHRFWHLDVGRPGGTYLRGMACGRVLLSTEPTP